MAVQDSDNLKKPDSNPSGPLSCRLSAYGPQYSSSYSGSPAGGFLGNQFSLALKSAPMLNHGSYLTLPSTSVHINAAGNVDNRFNAKNSGIGIEVPISPTQTVVAGAYLNSYSRNTVYAGMAYTPLQTSIGPVKLSAGAIAGVATGYSDYTRMSIGGVSPVLALHFSAAMAGVGLNMTVLPPAPGPTGVTALALAAKFELK